MENKKYDDTVSNSKDESLSKAINILQQEYDENDKIKIDRPEVNNFYVISRFVFILLIQFVLVFTCFFVDIKIKAILLLVLLFLTYITLKNTIINFVLLYQKYAPEKLRSACLFTPTCSEYMILALKKYGTIRGTIKGIGRVLRCHSPNGGEDYP